ncbi:unnamed protein product [Prorocentrum cordatum]|uniref:F-box domain-containing protein n=1 Tax=Prorocentrum cordatum TaxID=2364126 RepID=A0ABN9RSH4_9DINO|nr:unnamed protein product [Polarella glacialis]
MSNGDGGLPAGAMAGRPTRRGSALRRKEEAEVGASAARRRARARRLLAATAAVGKAASGGPGSWQDREAAARPALRRAAAGRRVPGAMRRRRNAAWHALLVPAGGFARASVAGLSRAAAGPRLGWLPSLPEAAALPFGDYGEVPDEHCQAPGAMDCPVVAVAVDGSVQTELLGGEDHLDRLRRVLRQRLEAAQRPALKPAAALFAPLPEVLQVRIVGMLSLPDRLRLCQASTGVAWTFESSPCRLAEALESDLRDAALLQQLEGARLHRDANADVDLGRGFGSDYQLDMLRGELHHPASNRTQYRALVAKQAQDIRSLREGWAAAEHALRDQLATLREQLQAYIAMSSDAPAAAGEHNDDASDGSLSSLVVEDRGDDCEFSDGFDTSDVLLDGTVGLRALPPLPALTDCPIGFRALTWLWDGRDPTDMRRIADELKWAAATPVPDELEGDTVDVVPEGAAAPGVHVDDIELDDLQAIIQQHCAAGGRLRVPRGAGPAAAGDTTAPAGTNGDGFGDVGGRSVPYSGDGIDTGFLSAGELLEAAAASRLALAAASFLLGVPLEAPQALDAQMPDEAICLPVVAALYQ